MSQCATWTMEVTTLWFHLLLELGMGLGIPRLHIEWGKKSNNFFPPSLPPSFPPLSPPSSPPSLLCFPSSSLPSLLLFLPLFLPPSLLPSLSFLSLDTPVKDSFVTEEHLLHVWKQQKIMVASVFWILFSTRDSTPDSVPKPTFHTFNCQVPNNSALRGNLGLCE